MPGDLAGHRFARTGGLEQRESLPVIICLSARMPGDRTAVPTQKPVANGDLSNILLCQNMAQGRFMMGAA